MSSIPGKNATTLNDHQCDGNCVAGYGCNELDIQEANMHAFRVTTHPCDSRGCDAPGCGVSLQNFISQGPGEKQKIDTTKQFNVKTEFEENNGTLENIKTTFTQDSKVEVFNFHKSQCEEWHFVTMGEQLKKGFNVILQNWGQRTEDMKWLDGDTGCIEKC